jgi:hypothetical protein
MSGLGVTRYYEDALWKATVRCPIDTLPSVWRRDALYEPHPCGSPFGPAEAVQNRSRRFCLSVIEEPVVIERILRHLGLWDPRPSSQAPPEDDDWPVNGQIPLTYESLPAIA